MIKFIDLFQAWFICMYGSTSKFFFNQLESAKRLNCLKHKAYSKLLKKQINLYY